MKKLLLLLFVLLLLPLNSWQSINIEDLRDDDVCVSVVGEVTSATTLKLKKGSKLKDAIDLIELSDEADLTRLNLNYILENNDVINIQSKNANLISINTADIELLVLLNGIGEKTAIKIIAYREENGLFKSIDELANVSGISINTIAKIRDKICL